MFRNQLGGSSILMIRWLTHWLIHSLGVVRQCTIFVFLDDNLILASTSAPPALLVYSLEQRHDDTTQYNTHILRFLFGPSFQYPLGFSKILIKSDPSPGCLPSTGQVPFQVAGDERMIALYSRCFNFGNGRMFLIPMKSFFGTN